MSEARYGAAGDWRRGHTGGQPDCVKCGHPHRVANGLGGYPELIYDAACGCGCTASGDDYDPGFWATIYDDTPDYVPYTRTTVSHDNDYTCPTHHISGPCACSGIYGRRDGSREAGVDPRGSVRRGWMDRVVWSRLSRLSWDLGRELVRQRRNV